jgi:hypothetical protein
MLGNLPKEHDEEHDAHDGYEKAQRSFLHIDCYSMIQCIERFPLPIVP